MTRIKDTKGAQRKSKGGDKAETKISIHYTFTHPCRLFQ